MTAEITDRFIFKSSSLTNTDKMEAAAAGITGQRLSTGGVNTPASSELQSTTPVSSKASVAGSETGQTSVTGSSTTLSKTSVASSALGMYPS